MIRALAAGGAIAVVIAGCLHGDPPRRATGTCAGACDYYVACKHDRASATRSTCLAECPEVFGDRTSIAAFEALSCRDAIEYVDGLPGSAATTARAR